MLLSSYSFQSLQFRGLVLWLSRNSSTSSFDKAEQSLKFFEDTLIQIEDDESATRVWFEEHNSVEVSILHNAANQTLAKANTTNGVRASELFIASVFGDEEKTLAVSCPRWIDCSIVDNTGEVWSMPKEDWHPFSWQIFTAEDIPVEKIVSLRLTPFASSLSDTPLTFEHPRHVAHRRVADLVLSNAAPTFSHTV